MSDRTQRHRNRVEDGSRLWRANVTLHYANAYAVAYDEYQKVLKEQAEADKARAELFVSMASMLGGSLLMATIGQSALKAAISNVMLSTICRFNLDRAFEAMAVAEANKTIAFAIDKTTDVIGDQAKKAITDAATKLLAEGSSILTSNPQVKQNELEEQLIRHELVATETGDRIESSSKLTAHEKDKAFVVLTQAAICHAPQGSIDSPTLAAKIELGIYLKAVLDSVRLEIWPKGYDVHAKPPPSQTIPYPPSDPRFPYNKRFPAGEAGTTLSFHQLGPKVKERADKLHHDIFGPNFFIQDARMWNPFSPPPSPGENRAAELRLAEAHLNALATKVRPGNFLAVRS